MRNYNSQKGQVLLIVTLTMIVALTVGLSLISRSLTNLKISKQNEESQRAFSAAEAGVERALKQSSSGTVGGDFLNNNATFSTKTENVDGSSFLLNNDDMVSQNVGIDVWLSDYNTNPALSFQNPFTGTLRVYWTSTSNPDQTGGSNCAESQGATTTPAVEILVLRGSKLSPVLDKYFYDDCLGRQGNNGATPPPNSGGVPARTVLGTIYGSRSGDISIVDGLIMKVVPIYNSTRMAVGVIPPPQGLGPDLVLPSQGSTIVSTGTSGDTTRRIEVFNTHPQIPPEMFQYAILSQ